MANDVDVVDVGVVVANARDQLVDHGQALAGHARCIGAAKGKQGIARQGKLLGHGGHHDGSGHRGGCGSGCREAVLGLGHARDGVHLQAHTGHLLQRLGRGHGLEHGATRVLVDGKVLALRGQQAGGGQAVVVVFGGAAHTHLASANLHRPGLGAQLAVATGDQRGVVLAIDKHARGAFEACAVTGAVDQDAALAGGRARRGAKGRAQDVDAGVGSGLAGLDGRLRLRPGQAQQ